MRNALILAALSLAAPAFADDELNPEKVAKIERDTEKALEKVDKKWGNKKPSELTSDERKQVIQERAAAEREVFEKNNVDAKAYTKYTSRQTKSERAATKEASARLEEQEKTDAAQAQKDKETKQQGGPKEIVIQRGGAGKDPIIMEEVEGAPPIVEKGLPQEAQDEQSDANALTDSSTESNPNAPAPAKGSGKGPAKKK